MGPHEYVQNCLEAIAIKEYFDKYSFYHPVTGEIMGIQYPDGRLFQFTDKSINENRRINNE